MNQIIVRRDTKYRFNIVREIYLDVSYCLRRNMHDVSELSVLVV
jgi:hypothetical protein